MRLILQHGLLADAAFNRHLLPPEILVVTFTDAATQELRDRIRAKLVEAAQVFRGEQDTPDALLESLREDYPAQQWPHARNGLIKPHSGWMKPLFQPSTHGVSACCASMPLIAAACLRKP